MKSPLGTYSPLMPEGKRSLMEAALRLADAGVGITSIGIRELAREAGLNPNTFYKHFDTLEGLGLALIAILGDSLRLPMQALRHKAAEMESGGLPDPAGPEALLRAMVRRIVRVNRETVRLLFDFVEEHPQAFSLAMRELHGASPAMRAALRQFVGDCTADMAADIRALNLVPFLDDGRIDEVARLIAQQMLALAQEYVAQPARRADIRIEAEIFPRTVVLGTLVQQDLDAEMLLVVLKAYRQAQADEPRRAVG